ncbi:membrane-bound hydrophilic protein [Streptomyces hygroscopicus]|uniref:hypothetical protein n=1 Tax=Streptomyces hygroscopicus TaxID=1912 RepID=UPI00223EDAD4|nr:hypothetical protein [Streptomyces hygroscopicus]MCW7945450.1 membrane-bound hydrophilic protein [Streptomyces hygroscopicus]
MPADEVTHGTDVDASRARTGPRHAAPRKPLFTRFHVPAGRAIALAAMPTAVFMGLGLNSTLARADEHPSKTMTADEYQKCVEVLDNAKGSKDASATPSPSASASAPGTSKSADTAQPTPSASADKSSDTSSGKTSSSDSGSGDKAAPAPSASASSAGSDKSSGSGTSTPTPSASTGGGGLLDDLGGAIKNVFNPGDKSSASASATPSPSASSAASATKGTSSSTVTDTTKKVTDTVTKTVKDTTDTATKAASAATKAAGDTVTSAASAATSPSPGSSASAANCPAATTDQGGVEQTLGLPDAPWHLQASSLLLKGADYQGVVKVRTANGTVKRVLKYVISGGTDIGDLHQLVDGQKGETYHVQAGQGTTSTIRGGKTVMYTESISGNLFGLIPVTFSPDNPPPLNIPLIYFTNVKVTQAGQFGGTLTVPGMHQFVTGWS